MTKLTLCLIARDEAHFLPGCLASVADVVDEMIVVDTGSTDDTVQIAERAGARVIRHTWNDDFSAARNAAIAEVREGFVLILDASERLVPGAGAALRTAIERDDFDIGRLPLHDATALDASPEDVLSGVASAGPAVLLERVLRRTPDLAWEGVVHEHVTSWASKGRRAMALDAPIIHFGAVPELRTRLGKSERNLRLLERAVQREPQNAAYRTYFAQDLLRAGELERAWRELSTAWDRIAACCAAGEPAANGTTTATLRAFLQLRNDDYDGAAQTIRQAREWNGDHPNLCLLTAVLHERRWFASGESAKGSAELSAAATACEACFGFADRALDVPALPGSTSWAAATRLGTIRLLQGDPASALQSFEDALATDENHLEARLGRAEALIFGGHGADALPELMTMLESGVPDAWILAARAGFEFGGREQVAPMLEQARRSLQTTELLAGHRRWLLEELEALHTQGGVA
ncbi:MAG: glycosyltransferase [Planctomycetes bacterium]|nr:glycosyltransferase [Planctomycetota bacterium]MCB9903016.1 glycosyltransferase [Planctomycetota bacterium]